MRFFGCRKRRKKVKVPNYARATVRAAMTKNRRKNGNFQGHFTGEPPFLIYCKQTDLRISVLFWHRVKYSCLMNIENTTSRMITSRIITSRISKITQITLNYFTFLPATLILNSDDFELFYLPTCHPDTELR